MVEVNVEEVESSGANGGQRGWKAFVSCLARPDADVLLRVFAYGRRDKDTLGNQHITINSLYRRDNAFVIMAIALVHECLPLITAGEVVGLAAGAINPSVYYTQMLRKRGFQLIWRTLKRVVKEPRVLVSIAQRDFSGFFRPNKSEEAYSKAAFDVIGVKEEYRNMGVALQLIKSFLDELRERRISEVHFGVLSDNTRLKRFYEMIGFKRLSTHKHPDGGEVDIYGMRFDENPRYGG